MLCIGAKRYDRVLLGLLDQRPNLGRQILTRSEVFYDFTFFPRVPIVFRPLKTILTK